MKDRIAKWYKLGLWSKEMVKKAVEKNVLSAAEADRILEREEK